MIDACKKLKAAFPGLAAQGSAFIKEASETGAWDPVKKTRFILWNGLKVNKLKARLDAVGEPYTSLKLSGFGGGLKATLQTLIKAAYLEQCLAARDAGDPMPSPLVQLQIPGASKPLLFACVLETTLCMHVDMDRLVEVCKEETEAEAWNMWFKELSVNSELKLDDLLTQVPLPAAEENQ